MSEILRYMRGPLRDTNDAGRALNTLSMHSRNNVFKNFEQLKAWYLFYHSQGKHLETLPRAVGIRVEDSVNTYKDILQFMIDDDKDLGKLGIIVDLVHKPNNLAINFQEYTVVLTKKQTGGRRRKTKRKTTRKTKRKTKRKSKR